MVFEWIKLAASDGVIHELEERILKRSMELFEFTPEESDAFLSKGYELEQVLRGAEELIG